MLCCGARRKETRAPRAAHAVAYEPAAHGSEELDLEEQEPDRDSDEEQEAPASVHWRVKMDESYAVFVHETTGTVVELALSSKGWFACRDPQWKMHTLYPEGSVDTPRVQVFDAEHIITDLRFDFEQELVSGISQKEEGAGNHARLVEVAAGDMGNWEMAVSEHNQVLLSNKRAPGALLVLISTGLCFVGSSGDAVLVDEAGISRLGAKEARALLPAE